MSGIDSYSITPASNATADGGAINWAEGQPPSSVNNTARQMLADTRSATNDLIWFQYGTGDQGAGNIAVPSVYASGTSFTITGADVTLVYHAGRRVRAVGVSTGTIYGTISSSSYNSGNTKTTVNVTWDSGSLSNETLVVSLCQMPVTGKPVPSTAIADSSPSYTPTDQSGATLTFSSVAASSSQIGNIVCCHGTLTFPSTVDGSAIKILLPVANGSTTHAYGTGVNATSGVIYLLDVIPSQNYFQLFATPTAASAIVNSAFSSAILRFAVTYNVN